MAPKGWLTSYQMLLSACYQSVGVGIGAPLGGWVMVGLSQGQSYSTRAC
jgi:hypothetical protein